MWLLVDLFHGTGESEVVRSACTDHAAAESVALLSEVWATSRLLIKEEMVSQLGSKAKKSIAD